MLIAVNGRRERPTVNGECLLHVKEIVNMEHICANLLQNVKLHINDT